MIISTLQFQSKIIAFCLHNRISNAAGNGLLAMLNEAQHLEDVQIPLDFRCMVSRISGHSSSNSNVVVTSFNLSNLHYSFDNIADVNAS